MNNIIHPFFSTTLNLLTSQDKTTMAFNVTASASSVPPKYIILTLVIIVVGVWGLCAGIWYLTRPLVPSPDGMN